MKTHDLAKALTMLSRLLKAGRNVELKDWTGPDRTNGGSGSGDINTADAATALNVLVGLSRYSKGQWRSLIEEWSLPITVLQTDSVRDLVGRLLNYLGEHRDELQRIQVESRKKSGKASPELSKVLSILLGGETDEAESAEKQEHRGNKKGAETK